MQSITHEVNLKHMNFKLIMDNTAAITTINNPDMSLSQLKHVDVCFRHIQDLKSKGLLQTVFAQSEDNVSDTMTKSLPVGPFTKHKKSYMCMN